jgi:hypothetical protein
VTAHGRSTGRYSTGVNSTITSSTRRWSSDSNPMNGRSSFSGAPSTMCRPTSEGLPLQGPPLSPPPQRLSYSMDLLPSVRYTTTRHFSTATASADKQATLNHGESKQQNENVNGGGAEDTKEKEKKSKADDSTGNLFLDHLGKIFLLVIASIIGTLIRGSYNTTNRNNVRDWLETTSALDPMEVDDLRVANSELTLDVFEAILQDLYGSAPSVYTTGDDDNSYSAADSSSAYSGNRSAPRLRMTYSEFVTSVRRTMIRLKGDAFTIQLGHLLDRVVVSMLRHYAAPSKTTTGTATLSGFGGDSREEEDFNHWQGAGEEPELPLSLWLTVLSLALNSTIDERIKLLHKIMVIEQHLKKDREQGPSMTMSSSSSSMDSVSSFSEEMSSSSSLDASNVMKSTSLETTGGNSGGGARHLQSTEEGEERVAMDQVHDMVGYLQESCQLSPDTQVVKIVDEYIPTQQFRRGTPQELVHLSLEDLVKEEGSTLQGDVSAVHTMKSEEFTALLKSKMVCAWGECYHKKKR